MGEVAAGLLAGLGRGGTGGRRLGYDRAALRFGAAEQVLAVAVEGRLSFIGNAGGQSRIRQRLSKFGGQEVFGGLRRKNRRHVQGALVSESALELVARLLRGRIAIDLMGLRRRRSREPRCAYQRDPC